MKDEEKEKEALENTKRLQDARADFEKIKSEIAPFLKNRKFRRYIAKDQWCETASLCK